MKRRGRHSTGETKLGGFLVPLDMGWQSHIISCTERTRVLLDVQRNVGRNCAEGGTSAEYQSG